jgi:cell division protein FtsB
LHNVTTIGWLRNRALTHDVAAQTVPASTTTTATEIIGSVLRSANSIPSWAVLTMIILAASGVCCTVILRSRAEFSTSSSQYQGMTSDIDSMRQTNQSLQAEINRLTSDSHAIELAARQRLGMVRPNDVVVPVESISSSTSLGTLSFVR